MRRRGLREATLAVVTVILLVPLLGLVEDRSLLRNAETASLDLRFRLRTAHAPTGHVTVVLVDDRSLAALGRWPLSRRVFARAVDIAHEAGATAVAFDLLFSDPEQPISPALRAAAKAAADTLPGDSEAEPQASLRRLAEEDPDAEFAAALRRAGNVLLPIAFTFAGGPPIPTVEPTGESIGEAGYAKFGRGDGEPLLTLRPTGVSAPVATLAAAAAGLGHVSWALDRDGAPRHDYLALPFEGEFIASLGVRAAAMHRAVPWPDVVLDLGLGVRIGDIVVPSDRAHRIVINYRGPRGTIPTVSLIDLLEGRVPDDRLRGRTVLIGASFIGASDSFASPFGATPIPGTERHATVADSILAEDFVVEAPPLLGLAGFIMLLGLAGATGAATARLSTRLAGLFSLVPIGLLLAVAQASFEAGVWVPLVRPLVGLTAAMLAVLLYRFWIVEQDGRRVRDAFRHYMAPELVDVLAAHPERLRLGGETRAMTLLFSDIRSFTTISERFRANPQGLTQLVNRFLTPMTDIIMARRGTIDKYMGDCVMAFWNAPLDVPDHPDRACEAALAMIAELATLNATLAEEAARAGEVFEPLRIGIGINTGDCVVGNMGSRQRFDYSVLGDAVNLASRLEGQSKTYGVAILLGEATRAAAPDWAAIELDRIAVKGKHEAVRIYALLGDAAYARSAEFAALARPHGVMLAAYRAQDWDEAAARLDDCRSAAPDLATLWALYDGRIRHYRAEPPGDGWDGVFVASTK